MEDIQKDAAAIPRRPIALWHGGLGESAMHEWSNNVDASLQMFEMAEREWTRSTGMPPQEAADTAEIGSAAAYVRRRYEQIALAREKHSEIRDAMTQAMGMMWTGLCLKRRCPTNQKTPTARRPKMTMTDNQKELMHLLINEAHISPPGSSAVRDALCSGLELLANIVSNGFYSLPDPEPEPAETTEEPEAEPAEEPEVLYEAPPEEEEADDEEPEEETPVACDTCGGEVTDGRRKRGVAPFHCSNECKDIYEELEELDQQDADHSPSI